mmetsp:Transcript_37814/g.85817  ORF Transcript_37814/g.85817 Transcript_37814/m.85817 type:complete len:86 (+) Transcript_37814:238-495(+)
MLHIRAVYPYCADSVSQPRSRTDLLPRAFHPMLEPTEAFEVGEQQVAASASHEVEKKREVGDRRQCHVLCMLTNASQFEGKERRG